MAATWGMGNMSLLLPRGMCRTLGARFSCLGMGLVGLLAVKRRMAVA